MSKEVQKSSKSEFISNLAAQMTENLGREVTKKEARDALVAFEDVFYGYQAAAAAEKSEIQVQMFGGTVKFVFIPEHESRNPRTGDAVTVPDRVAVRLNTAPKNADSLI